MRPGYAEAVEATRRDRTFWRIWVLPALMIWLTVPQQSRGCLPAAVIFAAAVFTCWLSAAIHLDHIQDTKMETVLTEEERWDLSADTWLASYVIAAVPPSFLSSTLHASLAHRTVFVAGRIGGRRRGRVGDAASGESGGA